VHQITGQSVFGHRRQYTPSSQRPRWPCARWPGWLIGRPCARQMDVVTWLAIAPQDSICDACSCGCRSREIGTASRVDRSPALADVSVVLCVVGLDASSSLASVDHSGGTADEAAPLAVRGVCEGPCTLDVECHQLGRKPEVLAGFRQREKVGTSSAPWAWHSRTPPWCRELAANAHRDPTVRNVCCPSMLLTRQRHSWKMAV